MSTSKSGSRPLIPDASATSAAGLRALFALGVLVGAVLGMALFFWWSLIRGKRPVHAHGVVYRGELRALDDVVGPRLAGPALVRMGGALRSSDSPDKDVLALALRLRKAGDRQSLDARIGDQDLLLATFESFHTVIRDLARTDQHDFLANTYSSVAPFRIDGFGIGKVRAVPPSSARETRADVRSALLEEDVARGRAKWTLVIDGRGGSTIAVAELVLIERSEADGSALRISMFRTGRGFHPTGFRNGLRASVYPLSQLARRLRGA